MRLIKSHTPQQISLTIQGFKLLTLIWTCKAESNCTDLHCILYALTVVTKVSLPAYFQAKALQTANLDQQKVDEHMHAGVQNSRNSHRVLSLRRVWKIEIVNLVILYRSHNNF